MRVYQFHHEPLIIAVRGGFEPPITVPETVVLPFTPPDNVRGSVHYPLNTFN
jgi:hypothetical protein